MAVAGVAHANILAEPNLGTGLAEDDPMGSAIQVASGGSQTFAIRQDGTVQAWGRNTNGQLALGDTTDRLAPANVASITTARRFALGTAFGVVLLANGSVQTWGDNTYGQLGLGDTAQRTSPATVTLPAAALQVFAGDHHAGAILADGTVYMWGRNDSGQLGDGTTTQRLTPVPVASLLGARSLALGGAHSMAIAANGTVWAWGENGSGQLGLGDTVDRNAPTQIAGLTGSRQVSAGGAHSGAIEENGTGWMWGENADGQVGDGTTTDRTSPTSVSSLDNSRQLSLGTAHSTAIANDGSAYAWGRNITGELGLGDLAAHPTPTTVTSVGAVRWISASSVSTTFVEVDGDLLVSGGSGGEVGDGTAVLRLVPAMSDFRWGYGFVILGAGNYSSMGVRSDGTLWTWGNNANGELGLGNTTDRTTPTQVTFPGGLRVRNASIGWKHAIAMDEAGEVWTWGDNVAGGVGNGTTTDAHSPVKITLPGGRRARQVIAGGDMTFVQCTDGTVYSWGRNTYGNLAIGSTTQQTSPTLVPALVNARQITTGMGYFGHAITSTGDLVGWGINSGSMVGPVGDGTTTNRTSPVPVALTKPRYAVDGGYAASAVSSTGQFYIWGENTNHAIGNNSTVDQTSPLNHPVVNGPRHVATGARQSIVVAATGETRLWGANDAGQQGQGNTTDRPTPWINPAYVNVRQAAAGGFHSLVLQQNGTMMATGDGAQGQLGRGSTADSTSLITVTATPAPPDTQPPVPWPTYGGVGTATSTTAIDWTAYQAYDETALHAVPYSIDTGVASWQAGRTLTTSGLTVNTQYSRTMRARDAALNITTGTATAWTWTGVPGSPSATPSWDLTDGNRALLTWTAPAGGVSAYVVRSSLDSYAAALDTTTSLTSTITALPANTAITFRICGVNGGGVETPAAGCTSASITTPPAAPTAVAIASVTDTSFSVSWTAPAGATSQEVTTYSNAACTVPVDTDTSSSPFAQSGLSRDRIYRVTVRAFSASSGVWGAPSACIAPPGIARTALTVSAPASLDLGSGAPGAALTGTSTVTVDSYAATAFDLQASMSAPPTSGANTVPDTTSGTLGTPGAWSGTGFGFTISSAPGLPGKWGAGANFAPMPSSATTIYSRTGMTANTANTTSVDIGYRLVAASTQAVGAYSTTITYVAVATT